MSKPTENDQYIKEQLAQGRTKKDIYDELSADKKVTISYPAFCRRVAALTAAEPGPKKVTDAADDRDKIAALEIRVSALERIVQKITAMLAEGVDQTIKSQSRINYLLREFFELKSSQ